MLAGGGLEAALIASPASFRFEQAASALRAGLHVLVEPPVTSSIAEARVLSRLAEERGRVLAPACPRRYEPAFAALQERLLGGEVGEPVQVRCQWTASTVWAERRGVYRTWEGVFRTLSWQAFDLCRWLLGEPSSVSADLDPLDLESRDAIGNLIVQHERGLAIHHLRRSGRSHAIEQVLASGSRGMLRVFRYDKLGDEECGSYRVTSRTVRGDEAEVPLEDRIRGAGNPRSAMLAAFAARCRGEASPLPGAAEIVSCVEALYAAELSSEEKSKIALPLGDTANGVR
jgi:predicted dehydrogenase